MTGHRARFIHFLAKSEQTRCAEIFLKKCNQGVSNIHTSPEGWISLYQLREPAQVLDGDVRGVMGLMASGYAAD